MREKSAKRVKNFKETVLCLRQALRVRIPRKLCMQTKTIPRKDYTHRKNATLATRTIKILGTLRAEDKNHQYIYHRRASSLARAHTSFPAQRIKHYVHVTARVPLSHRINAAYIAHQQAAYIAHLQAAYTFIVTQR